MILFVVIRAVPHGAVVAEILSGLILESIDRTFIAFGLGRVRSIHTKLTVLADRRTGYTT